LPYFDHDDTTIYYEEHGAGFPLLLIAPGGMRSAVGIWSRVAIDPLTAYAGDFRLIAMDQRNAGQSRGPLAVDDPWGAYVGDQLALLDHLGVDRFLVMGCCIGGSYILKLAEQAPERVVAAVLEQPIGIHEGNAALFDEMWRSWAKDLEESRSDLDAATLEAFGLAMWADDFVVSVPRAYVSTCPTPMLVLPGTDDFHPTVTGREIAALAPHAELLEPWKETPEQIEQTVDAARRFLLAHAA
jgi:pimeloyl-ACP methyl ester carboxylesterase